MENHSSLPFLKIGVQMKCFAEEPGKAFHGHQYGEGEISCQGFSGSSREGEIGKNPRFISLQV
jgi:hypothetical protein